MSSSSPRRGGTRASPKKGDDLDEEAAVAALIRSIAAKLIEPKVVESLTDDEIVKRLKTMFPEPLELWVQPPPEKADPSSITERAQALAKFVRERDDKKRLGLLPARHTTPDFFVADIVDFALKSDMATMEVPTFSLQTKPDMETFVWTSADGKRSVKIVPSEIGRATMFDKDLLIYVTSQLVASINAGGPVSKTFRYSPYAFFTSTNRRTDGDEYARHEQALTRLAGTRIKTNVITGRQRIRDDFSFVDRVRAVEKEERTGRVIWVEMTVSDWLWNAIQEREVLTINSDYFRLRKALERRIYELARKHVGQQSDWAIQLTTLHEKSGSQASLKEFKRMLKDIIYDGNVPDYLLELVGDDVLVRSKRRLVQAVDNF